MSSFLVLALASSALAVPFVGQHGHNHAQHRHQNHVASTGIVASTGTGAPYPYPNANSTGIYASAGTAISSGSAVSTIDVDAAYASTTSTSCTSSTTYVTETNRVTVTVQRSSTAEATSTYADLRKKAYEGKQRWHKSSSSSSAAQSSTAASSVAAASTSASQAASSSVAATTATSSTAAATSSATSSSGKRGLAYNDASLTTPFEGSTEVSWAYNWGQSSSGLSSDFEFVPLLWGTGSSFTSTWAATVSAAADKGITHLMSFNEPDLSSQANLSPADAATAYKKYMQPYAGQFKLGAPAVTNGGGSMGLTWLSEFLTACDGCTIDFVAAHWYDSATNIDYFKSHVADIKSTAGDIPVWLTEFGCTSGTDDEISTFLETVMPWMDSLSYVERYAYFMVADGYLVDGSSLSSYGSVYSTYTS